MFRTIIKAQKRKLHLTLPENYAGKDVEIFVFPVDDLSVEKMDDLKSFSAISYNTKNYRFSREEANER